MRIAIWLVLMAALAVALALLGRLSDGYAVVVVPPWRLELSFNMLVISVVLACLAFYAVARLAAAIVTLPEAVRSYRLRRTRNRARSALREALFAYFEGRYQATEKSARNALAFDEARVLAAVVAARTAHSRHDREARDRHLDEIPRDDAEARLIRTVAEAEFKLDDGEHAEALKLIRGVRPHAAKSVRLAELELKAALHERDWSAVLELTDTVEAAGSLSPEQAAHFRRTAHAGNLARLSHDARGLADYWRKLPEGFRTSSVLATLAARQLQALDDGDSAAQIIEWVLEKEWDPALVRLYAEVTRSEPLTQLGQAELWLKEHPHDASLLFTLGTLCERQELWGKAQSYLEASLALEESVEIHEALAALQERLGRNVEAAHHAKRARELTS